MTEKTPDQKRPDQKTPEQSAAAALSEQRLVAESLSVKAASDKAVSAKAMSIKAISAEVRGAQASGAAEPAARFDRRKQVVIVQQVLKQYRLAFFNALHEQLAAQHIDLWVVYGQPGVAEATKQDHIRTPAADFYLPVAVRQFGPLVWQWHPRLRDADVVVVEQANRHLLNYLLNYLMSDLLPERKELTERKGLTGGNLLKPLLKSWLDWPHAAQCKLVLWGHGFDHQQTDAHWRRHWKNRQLRHAAHFWAYTEAVARYVKAQGMTAVTVLNNSQDCQALMALPARQDSRVRPLVLLYCGALYPAKRLPLLLATCEVLATEGLLARLIVLGDGPDRALLEQPRPWLDWRGACFDEQKTAAFAQADLVLNPGLTGLAILDAFAAGLPYVTTSQPDHSPEISYLEPGVNGEICAPTVAALVAVIRSLVAEPARRLAMGDAARQSAQRYSLAQMVERASGSLQAIAGKRRFYQWHQPYRQRGGEDSVAEREAALFARQQLPLERWPQSHTETLTRWQQLKALAGWFGWPDSEQRALLRQLRPGDVLLVHNLFPRASPWLLRRARRQGAFVLCYLHNFRPLTASAVLSADKVAASAGAASGWTSPGWTSPGWTSPGWGALKQQWQQPGRPEGRLISLLLQLAINWQYRLKLWQQSSLLICPSDFVRRQYLAAGFAPELLCVKPHYCPSKEQTHEQTHEQAYESAAALQALQERLSAQPYVLLVTSPNHSADAGFASRAAQGKGLALVRALWQQQPQLPQLLIAGDHAPSVRACAPELSPAQLGYLGALSAAAMQLCYRHAMVLLVPSQNAETFGNVVIEAFREGTPVLASNLGALPELVGDGGRLFRHDDAADLLNQLQFMLAEPQQLQSAGERALARYQAFYSEQAQLQYYRDWFGEFAPACATENSESETGEAKTRTGGED